jgi:uncharacterized membrane protein
LSDAGGQRYQTAVGYESFVLVRLDTNCERGINHRKPYRDVVQSNQRGKAAVETNIRSIAKAVSYRILGSAVTGIIVFVLTGKGTLSLSAGALDIVLKIGAYFVHERVWDRIEFGRAKPPEYEI